VPPVNTKGAGTGLLALVPGTNSRLAAGVIFKDLASRPTAVHLHGPASPGANGPVLFTLKIISAKRKNQKWSGEAVGLFNITTQQLADLRAGRWYLDVHTEGRTHGEIRGQVTVGLFASNYLNSSQESIYEACESTAAAAAVVAVAHRHRIERRVASVPRRRSGWVVSSLVTDV